MTNLAPIELPKVDYRKLDWYWQQHHERFKRYVLWSGFVCQECHGGGGWTDPILDDGSGPWEACGWCEGIGYVTRHIRGAWLRYKREAK